MGRKRIGSRQRRCSLPCVRRRAVTTFLARKMSCRLRPTMRKGRLRLRRPRRIWQMGHTPLRRGDVGSIAAPRRRKRPCLVMAAGRLLDAKALCMGLKDQSLSVWCPRFPPPAGVMFRQELLQSRRWLGALLATALALRKHRGQAEACGGGCCWEDRVRSGRGRRDDRRNAKTS